MCVRNGFPACRPGERIHTMMHDQALRPTPLVALSWGDRSTDPGRRDDCALDPPGVTIQGAFIRGWSDDAGFSETKRLSEGDRRP